MCFPSGECGLERPLPGRLAIGGNQINVCEGMSHVFGQVSHWGDGDFLSAH